jgi:hypothetical protein
LFVNYPGNNPKHWAYNLLHVLHSAFLQTRIANPRNMYLENRKPYQYCIDHTDSRMQIIT